MDFADYYDYNAAANKVLQIYDNRLAKSVKRAYTRHLQSNGPIINQHGNHDSDKSVSTLSLHIAAYESANISSNVNEESLCIAPPILNQVL